MKDRIAHIMRAKNLKASDFAALLGIQPSAISHILSGRNQPSLEFVKKIKENFPEYNLDWIVFGTGPITTSDPFHINTPDPLDSAQTEIPLEDPITPLPVSPQILEQANTPSASSSVKAVVILYDDGTFMSYNPR